MGVGVVSIYEYSPNWEASHFQDIVAKDQDRKANSARRKGQLPGIDTNSPLRHMRAGRQFFLRRKNLATWTEIRHGSDKKHLLQAITCITACHVLGPTYFLLTVAMGMRLPEGCARKLKEMISIGSCLCADSIAMDA